MGFPDDKDYIKERATRQLRQKTKPNKFPDKQTYRATKQKRIADNIVKNIHKLTKFTEDKDDFEMWCKNIK